MKEQLSEKLAEMLLPFSRQQRTAFERELARFERTTGTPIELITTNSVQAYIDTTLDGASFRKPAVQALRMALEAAGQEDLPMKRRLPAARIVLSIEQIVALQAHYDRAESSPRTLRDAVCVGILLETGCSIKELLYLDWEDLNDNELIITTLVGRERHRLSVWLVAKLNEWRAICGVAGSIARTVRGGFNQPHQKQIELAVSEAGTALGISKLAARDLTATWRFMARQGMIPFDLWQV